VNATREAVVAELAGLVGQAAARCAGRVCRVGVDGVDGAGKTVLADELAAVVRDRGLPVVRAGIDGFHHPREIRYRRGRGSPSGFYEDSYDLPLLRRVLLDPLGPGGNRRVRTAARDVATDAELDPPVLEVAAGGVLLFDGIFLHRPQLRDVWDLSVWVEAPFEVTYARMAVRDGCPPDPDDPRNARYRLGQQLYLDACDPAARADLVLENADPANPVLTRAGGQGRSTARMPIAGSGS